MIICFFSPSYQCPPSVKQQTITFEKHLAGFYEQPKINDFVTYNPLKFVPRYFKEF